MDDKEENHLNLFSHWENNVILCDVSAYYDYFKDKIKLKNK